MLRPDGIGDQRVKKDCDIHLDAWECPDALMARMGDGSIGIIYHDGGASVNVVNYCPWCGKSIKIREVEEMQEIFGPEAAI